MLHHVVLHLCFAKLHPLTGPPHTTPHPLQGLHSKHEDWLATGTASSRAPASSRPGGLILPYDAQMKPDQQYAFNTRVHKMDQPGPLSMRIPDAIKDDLHLIQPPDSVALAKGFLQVGPDACLLACLPGAALVVSICLCDCVLQQPSSSLQAAVAPWQAVALLLVCFTRAHCHHSMLRLCQLRPASTWQGLY